MDFVRTRFGRAKFGGGQKLLIALSILMGSVLATVFGVLVALTQFTDNRILVAGCFFVVLAPAMSTIAWALMVDRSTIDGAIDQPEKSIENHWYLHAAQDTLHLGLVSVGVLGTVSTFWDFSVSGSMLTIYLGAFQIVAFSISYRLRKWRES
ncbi:hypothetical protein [Corynebacterium parakroppenstedtii]|uniref:hypothetical protein n=1 Tax=Corynebacterium parakroppenstedtii TaxID=2828363 RepID=UPI001C8F5F45|nr:hypothetical protein [Corynebacterium parakroppenstedtii]MBY0794355.1 hypothetical protein [Corynebacterium parakroppenstedtii]